MFESKNVCTLVPPLFVNTAFILASLENQILWPLFLCNAWLANELGLSGVLEASYL